MSRLSRYIVSLMAWGLLVFYCPRTLLQAPTASSFYLASAPPAAAAAAAATVAETVRAAEQGSASAEHSTAPGPGRTTGLEITDEVLESLVSAPPPLRGFQHKTGMLTPEKWADEYKVQRAEDLASFKREALNGTVKFLKQPESKFSECKVYLSHEYKYIWVRSLKTGSTSVLRTLGQACNGVSKWIPGKNCGTATPWHLKGEKLGDAEKWWKEYFVFSVVRNPYSRFASAYFFLNDTHALSNQTFGEACKDPFLRGVERDPSSPQKLDELYSRHIGEQTPCLFTQEGGSTVDFIAQTENLSEDFEQIIHEINKKRRAGVPPLQKTLGGYVKTNSEKGINSSYAYVLKQYPHCLSYLDTLLAKEFHDLGYL